MMFCYKCIMSHKYDIKAQIRSSQGIRGNKILMGSIVVLLALPVVPRGTSADEIHPNMHANLYNDINTGAHSTELSNISDGLL